MRPWLVVVLAIAGCQRHREPVDAGPRGPVTVKLGRPVSEITGDRWPAHDATRPSGMHELVGPVELTIVLPGGRRFTTMTRSAIGSIDRDTHVLRDIEPELGVFPSWEAAVTALERQLDVLGVKPEHRWKVLRERRVQHPAYPLEGCVTLTGANSDRPNGAVLLDLDFHVSSPETWRIHEGWPACE
ncbi:MAG: hypothetical protein JNK82_04430 [Myxococcaceae bacterium]|nr:hypothetical protein [Myxococcaceae bacterium]